VGHLGYLSIKMLLLSYILSFKFDYKLVILYNTSMNWRHKSFKIFGLSLTEEKILGALEMAKSIQDISTDTDLSRTGINHALKNLIKKEIVQKLKIGKRRIYIAITPNQLVEKMQVTVDDVLLGYSDKKGARIKTSKENEFIIHVGAAEIVPAYQRIASVNKNERIKAIQHHRSWQELLEKISPAQLVDFNQSIVKNHLILDGMLNESAYESYQEEIKNNPQKNKEAIKSLEGRMADYTVFADNFFNYDSEIWLFKDTAMIINWHEEVAIEITNANMAGFLNDMFEFVKMGGRKVDHNKNLREVLETL